MQIIELDTLETVKRHAPLYETMRAFVWITFGNAARYIYEGRDACTIQALNGDCFDVFKIDGRWKALPAE